LRGVAPDSLATGDIYRGVIPFVAIQIIALGIVALWPALATWLPERLLG
jgi:TRAP-type mannitol/chloroaromatic compound transport system permease large subunit